MSTSSTPARRVAVILPAYNAAADLEHAVAQVTAGWMPFADTVSAALYVMDDGSTDDTAAVAVQLARTSELPLTLITNPTNLGLVATLKRGYTLALADTVFDATHVLKTDTDRDFDQSVVMARMLPLTGERGPGVAAGVRWRPIAEHEHPYEFARRRDTVAALERELGLGELDPPSCGTQLYRAGALRTLLHNPAIIGHTAKWGLDFLMPLVARASDIPTQIVKIEKGHFDPSRRPVDKVRSQYDTYAEVIGRMVGKSAADVCTTYKSTA